jgi:hypothetical protein
METFRSSLRILSPPHTTAYGALSCVLAVWFGAGYSPTDMAHEEPSARTETAHQRSSNKESSLSMRIFFQRHYTDLVRMVGHGLPESEGREKIQPLIAQYGDAKMREAVAELIEIDRSQEPPIARLTERARMLAKALLGPPPRPTAPATSNGAETASVASRTNDDPASQDTAAEQIEKAVKAPRSSVIPRFLDFLRQSGKQFDLAEDAKRESTSDQAAMAVLDVIVSEPKVNWLIAIRRSLRPGEQAALRRLSALYGPGFHPARAWPSVGNRGWVWKRYPVALDDGDGSQHDDRGETLYARAQD